MSSDITFFPVGNGDMTLIRLPGPRGLTILIDCYFMEEVGETRLTTIEQFYGYLPTDDKGRPYVDVFVLSHPDDDHCHNARDVLHLGPPDDYVDKVPEGKRKKIFVREMWSAPMVFRRKSSDDTELVLDAQAIKKEAKRRVSHYKEKKAHSNDGIDMGNRILILGQDQKKDGQNRLEGLEGIHVDVDQHITINDDGIRMIAHVRGPLPVNSDDNEEAALKNNRSSIILQMEVFIGGAATNLILMGGDAEVGIWQRLYQRHKKNLDALTYNLLLAPHHCSWGVLANIGDDNVDSEAKAALSQTDGGFIVASCKPIKRDADNPPSYKAKNQYIDIADDESSFFCTGEYPDTDDPEPLTFKFTAQGPRPPSEGPKSTTATAMATGLSRTEREHG